MTKRLKLIGIIAVAVLIVCIGLGIYFFVTLESFKFEESGFYPINGVQYAVDKGDKARNTENGMVIERKGDEPIVPETLPVYYNERNAVCLMAPMAYHSAGQENILQSFKLNYFTDVEWNADAVTLKNGRSTALEGGGFLHDGGDTYIFLQPVEISYADKVLQLPPMSYAVVYYNTWIQVYNSESGEFIFEDIAVPDVMAVCIAGAEYRINLGTDMVYWGGYEFMLNSAVDGYGSYF